jgi:hypothetical protein
MARARPALILLGGVLAGCHLLIAHAPPADRGPGERASQEAGVHDGPVEDAPGRDAVADRVGAEPLPLSCNDGTTLGDCSSQKPLRCGALLVLSQDCKSCGCPAGSTCNAASRCTGTLKAEITADAHVVEPEPATCFGALPALKIGRAWNGESHALLGLDLSSIPPHALVDSATLSVEVVSWSGTALPIEVRLLADPWSEAQVTWSSAPKPLAAPAATATLGWGPNLVDLKQVVEAWLASPYVRYGLVLEPTGTDKNSVQIASHEEAIIVKRPRLTLAFR